MPFRNSANKKRTHALAKAECGKQEEGRSMGKATLLDDSVLKMSVIVLQACVTKTLYMYKV